MQSRRPARRRPRRIAAGSTGLLAGVIAVALVAVSGVVVAASAAHAEGSSAVTVTAKEQDPAYTDAPFPDLAVTVSQTQDLRQQGIKVSWTGTGGHQSVPGSSSSGGSWFLQVFQCWGDDPADATRPDRTTCQYGGVASRGSTRDSTRRQEFDGIPAEDQPYSAPRASAFEGAYTSIPFRARNGEVVDSITTNDGGTKVHDANVDVNNNRFFNVNSTNEVPWAGSGADGTGAISFEVQTTMQSPGLGCGDPVDIDGEVRGASCWLVVLPRGQADNGAPAITQSGLFWDSWKHALAVKLDFAPVGARCAVGAAERQLAGSEIASLAVQSWQPLLCRQQDGAVFSHLASAESDALLAADTTQDAALALASYPLADQSGDLVYAPVALSGLAISFAVDRNPDPLSEVPDEYEASARLPFDDLKLTPRLLAKLLTNSYWGSLPTEADRSYLDPDNPENLTKDPEFREINAPEWSYQSLLSPAIADLLMPQGRSDAATAVWRYIMADPEGAAFMAGEPDRWGMTVNPWYATDAARNSSGTAFSVPRDNFPKADPLEFTPAGQGALNIVTWRPYVNDLDASAYLTLRGDGQRLGAWDPNSAPPKYGKSGRDLPGFQRVLGITDASAAARYEVHVAALRNPAGEYVAPTEAGLLAAAAAMQPVGAGGVVRAYDSASDAAKGSAAAYPLAMPVYAAANPARLSADLRQDYAQFIRYAVADGQRPGAALGELPAGYAPVPDSWVVQAQAAAQQIESGPAPKPTTSTPASTGGSVTTAPVGAGTASQPVQAAPAPADPAASGASSPALSGGTTPVDPVVDVAPAIPAALLLGVIAVVVAWLASRRRPIRT
ncbi:hypothetical protein ACGGZK_02075 [Agromyces sp. MMS24-K17]|uniref:hypothetical protein n=1 Tax=Agromyces sp. MMS24-K17 TaxID=3372850 RepID=UPI0037546BAB